MKFISKSQDAVTHFNEILIIALHGKRNTHQSNDDEQLIRVSNGIPAIIDNEIWERVQKKMDKNKRTSASYKAKVDYLLSGIIYCGKCGGAMV